MGGLKVNDKGEGYIVLNNKSDEFSFKYDKLKIRIVCQKK